MKARSRRLAARGETAMVETMKAYWLTGLGGIALDDCLLPPMDCGSVLLRTKRVSICATDVAYFRGYLHPPYWPVIPGHEYVGEVVAVRGPNTQLKVGDTVVYWGMSDFGGLAPFRAIRPLCSGTRRAEPWFTPCGFVDD